MVVEVAFNLPLRRTFDYAADGEQAARLEPGCRVVVPFGSRLRSGIVVRCKAAADVAEGRLKAVRHVTEAAPLFSAEALAFTRWVADYYFCTWGEVLNAALPQGMAVSLRARFRLRAGPPGPALLAGLSPAAQALLQAHETWQPATWKRGGATAEDLRWLWRQARPGGAVELTHEYAGTRQRPRLEKWVALTGASPPPPRPRRNPLRETGRDKVLRLLRTEGPVPMARLKSVVAAPGPVVKKLAAEGVAEVSERPVERLLARRAALPPEPFLPLNADQQAAFEALRTALAAGEYRAFLLEGVTGSGKTEVYLHTVRETLARGRSCLLLVPEIALTASIVDRFRARFGDEVAVLHSGMGEGERFDEWNRVHAGRARIVIGARSAVFAPLTRLGLVVVDEEHDPSYKQEETPRYNGRDAALWRARHNGAVALLGSATPSLEAFRNVTQGKLTRLVLPARIRERPLPRVDLIDLRTTPRQAGSAFFTLPLVEALRETLVAGEQALVFLNRRGFASLVRCTACGQSITCPNCSITLTLHQTPGRLRCHRCDHAQDVPLRCPDCGAEALKPLGLGTERIERDLNLMFPEARVLRMDGDSLRRKGELERMLAGIHARAYDIIIGTQVLSKGHDFPAITLVGAVLADVSLNLPDFRAPERTFQLLTQMAGRAGRGDAPGRVLVQTYNPHHYSLTHILQHDTAGFLAAESALRAESGMPPFVHHALVWVSGPEAGRGARLAGELAAGLRGAAAPGVRVLGPAEAPIRRINNRYRWMILLASEAVGPIHRTLRAVLDAPGARHHPRDRIAVDIDPYNVL